MRTNEETDTLVVKAIKAGNVKAAAIQAEAGLEMRELDRALQRLKRAGAISFASNTRTWSMGSR